MNEVKKHYYALAAARKATQPLMDQLIIAHSCRPTTIQITSEGEIIPEPPDPESEKIREQIKEIGNMVYTNIMSSGPLEATTPQAE